VAVCVCSSTQDAGLVLRGLLVDISLSVVGLLVDLVSDGITSSLKSGADGGIAVLGDVLVGFLGGSGTGALNGLSDVVGGVPGIYVRICLVGVEQ
jgi:hypothetical protein